MIKRIQVTNKVGETFNNQEENQSTEESEMTEMTELGGSY